MRILIVEDSDTVATLLMALFSAEVDMEVVGHAHNGRQGVDMVAELKPDIITMDVRMPVMDGLAATKEIMRSNPTPIVVISSSVSDAELKITFSAIEAGALTVIEKPRGMSHPDFDAMRSELVNTVRAMSEVKVVRRYSRSESSSLKDAVVQIPEHSDNYQIVAIGCSTGGPQALKSILQDLPADFSLPIVIVQHISPGFICGMAEWLQGFTPLKVCVSEDGQALEPGNIYFGPDYFHLEVYRKNGGLSVRLTEDEPVNGFRPSANPFLASVAEACGDNAIGCILTGMGEDGATGLLKIQQARGHTFVQDENSSVIFGMPSAALALGATQNIVKLDDISGYLGNLVNRHSADEE